MPMLEMPQVALHYTDEGPRDGRVLLFSNSLGTALEMWEPQLEASTGRFRVLRYDTRGHGRSSVPREPYSMADIGGDVVGLLDALGIASACYCGISLGGVTGMWLGVNAPGRIERLALCNTAPWLGPPEVMQSRMDAVRRDGLHAMVDAIMGRWFTADFAAKHPAIVAQTRAAVLATPAAGYVGCCAALRDVDLRPALRNITAPTLVVGGSFDPAPTIEAARALATAIPGAGFLELPAAHLSNIGAAAQFNERVLGFLAMP